MAERIGDARQPYSTNSKPACRGNYAEIIIKKAITTVETAAGVVDVTIVKPAATATKVAKDIVDAIASEIDPNDHSYRRSHYDT